MDTYHILNGDCLAEQLKQTTINQNLIVCRECLMDGPVVASQLADFWEIRAAFFSELHTVSKEEYFEKSVRELEQLNGLPPQAEVCLWFENDLFCQANMWFIISLLSKQASLRLFRVFPIVENEADAWKGFGMADTNRLEQSYQSKIAFTPEDVVLGQNLWAAFRTNNFEALRRLSQTASPCFEKLEEVCEAHIDRFPDGASLGRPERVVKEIIETQARDFPSVFREFSAREGVYGFGDLQLKAIYDKLILA